MSTPGQYFRGPEGASEFYNVAEVFDFTSNGGHSVIKLRHTQPTVLECLFAEEVAELWEPWMKVTDERMGRLPVMNFGEQAPV